MKSILINGQNLHEIEMMLVPYNDLTISHLRYPKQRILFEILENVLTLKIPAMLALELFRQSILSQDHDAQYRLSVSGKRIGYYFIDDFRYPNDHTDIITIKFKNKAGL